MSDEIKKFREAVEKFDEIQADLEVLKDQLDSSFDNYKNISDNSSETVDRLSKILQSINALQINTQSFISETTEKSEQIKNTIDNFLEVGLKRKVENNFSLLLNDINTLIMDFKRSTEKRIFNSESGLEIKKLNQGIIDQLSSINYEVYQTATFINTSISPMIEKIEKKDQELHDAIELNYNNIKRSIKTKNDQLKDEILENIRTDIISKGIEKKLNKEVQLLSESITKQIEEIGSETKKQIKEIRSETKRILDEANNTVKEAGKLNREQAQKHDAQIEKINNMLESTARETESAAKTLVKMKRKISPFSIVSAAILGLVLGTTGTLFVQGYEVSTLLFVSVGSVILTGWLYTFLKATKEEY